MDKSAKANFGELIGLGVLLLLVIMLSGPATRWGNQFFATTDGGTDGVEPTQKIEVVTEKACGVATMTVDFTKKYSASTSMTAQNATVYINGNEKGVVNEGSTFTAQGKDTLNVYYALDPAQTTYYAAHATGKVPCEGQPTAYTTSNILGKGSLAGALQDPVSELFTSSTAPTAPTVYNKKTLVALSTTALAIGVGGTETARAYLDWTNEEGYGVVDGNTLACRFTDSEIDQTETNAILDGQTLGAAKYVPSMTKFPLSAANQSAKYWAFPAIDGKKTPTSTLDIIINGDDTNQPTAAGNFSCEIIDTDLFVTDDGKVVIGVEDSDDNSNVGRSTEYLINVQMS